MPTDISSLGISVDTRQVSAADAALDRLAKAASDATAAVARMTAAATANASQTGNVAKQVMTAAGAHNSLAAAARGATSAHQAHAGAMMNSRMAAMEYEHSIRSIIDGLSAGMSPIRLFAMEGARLAQAYQMGGGASGALSMFGGILGKLMNPTVALTGAVVALGAGGIYAFDAWQQRLNALQGALNGLGRSTGLTLGGLSQLATQSAGGRTSSLQAMDAITAFTATGKISPDIMNRMAKPQAGQTDSLVQQYSRGMGVSYSDSVKTLAADLTSPTEGAAKLNKEFGLLDDNQMQLITHLDAGGQRLAAQGAILDALGPRVQGLADVTSIWGRAWDGVATAAANAVGYVGRFVSGPTPEEALAAVRARIAASGGPGATYAPDIEYGNLRTGRASASAADISHERSLSDVVASNALAASWTGFQQVAIEKSLDIGDITRRANPDIDRLARLTDDRNKLQAAMDTPGALGKTDRNAAQEALDRLNAGVKNFGTTAQIVARDSAAASAATMAQTGQQRTAITAMKAWSDAVREGGGYALAAAESMARWNDAIAQSNKQAKDALRDAQNDASLLGLSPLQRERRQTEIRFENMKREATTAPGATAIGTSPGVPTGGGADTPMSSLNPAQQAALLAKQAQMEGSPGNQPDYNNPGNIMFSSWAAAHGATGAGLGGVAMFPTLEKGMNAQKQVVFGQYGGGTIGQMAYGYLGHGTGGDASSYAGQLAKAVGHGGIGSDAAARPPASGVVPTGAAVVSTFAGDKAAAQKQALANDDAKRTLEVLNENNLALQRNQDLLNAKTAALGMNTQAQNTANAAAEIWNKMQLTAADKIALGNEKMGELTTKVNQQAATTAQQTQQQTNLNNITGFVGQAQDMASSFTSGAASDLASAFDTHIPIQSVIGQLPINQQMQYYTGHMSSQAARNQLAKNQIGDLARQEIFKFGLSTAEKGIMGSGSTPGLLTPIFNGATGLLGSLFGVGGSAPVIPGPTASAGGGIGGFFASLFGGGGAGAVLPGGTPLGLGGIGMNASGGVFGPDGFVPLRHYDAGGIASTPQAAIFGEGSGNEAYVPLADGRSIPVSMKSPTFGGGAAASTQHIYHVQGGDVNIAGNADEKIIPQMRAEMAAANKQMMDQLQRNTGQMSAKWSQRYG